jgi:RimJ/RimL family protein N-acetyltransferase
MELSTKRLILRPLRINDKNAIFEYHSDARANKYQGWIPKTIDDAETFIRALAPQLNSPDSWFQFALIEKEEQKLIGDIGIHFLNSEMHHVELGFTVHPNYQQKAYATEAISKIINYLFADLNKHRITASVDPDNTASIRLLEKLGFRKETHFIKSLFLNGKWVDDVIYVLLKEEWKE